MRLLIVDDCTVNRRLLRAELESAGHVVLEADNGVDALQKLARAAVDGIISDVLMPVMDGLRLCREVRGLDHAMRSIPIVIHTATYDSDEDRELARDAGADAFLLKPAPAERLLRALEQAASAAGMRVPAWPPASSAAVSIPVAFQRYDPALVRRLVLRNATLQSALEESQASVARQRSGLGHALAACLRAPLRHVCGYLALLEADPATTLGPDGHAYIHHISNAVERMDDVVTGILATGTVPAQVETCAS